MLQILRAGPSFRPKYFIIIAEVRRSKAFPSISCVLNASTCIDRDGSILEIFVIVSSISQSDTSIGESFVTINGACGLESFCPDLSTSAAISREGGGGGVFKIGDEEIAAAITVGC